MSAAPNAANVTGDVDPEVQYHMDRVAAIGSKKKKSLHDRDAWFESKTWLAARGFNVDEKSRTKAVKPAPSQGHPETVPYSEAQRRRKLGRPENLEAEFTLVSMALSSPEVLASFADQIDPEKFSGDAHRLIIAKILERRALGTATSFDMVTLGEELGRNIVFVEAGGREILARLATASPSHSDPAELLKIIHSLAERRQLMALGKEIARRAADWEDNDGDLLTVAKSQIEAITIVTPAWDPPLLGEDAPASPFPLEVLPQGLRDFIDREVRTNYYPADYLGLPCLTIAAGGIGRSVALQIHDAWTEFASLYSMVVGVSSSGKSTSIMKTAAIPVMKATRHLSKLHNFQLREYQNKKREYNTKRKNGEDFVDDLPEEPVEKRLVVEDITRESLITKLAENPYGLLLINDEMSDWLAGMNQYKNGSGNDRQAYLKIWSGITLTVDRRSHDNGRPITAYSPNLNICGGIQPSVLPLLANGGIADGFNERFLFAFPDPVSRRYCREPIDLKGLNAWGDAWTRLWDRNICFSSDDDPLATHFTDEAYARWADWYDSECMACEAEEFDAELEPYWAKQRNYVARMALIVEQIHWAYDQKSKNELGAVGMESLNAAIMLSNYFKAHYLRVRAGIFGPGAKKKTLAREILTWIRKGNRRIFTERDARSRFREALVNNPDELGNAIQWLVQRHCIRRLPDHLRLARSSNALPSYEVNPLLFDVKEPTPEQEAS